MHISAMIALYGIAVLFVFIRIVGVGTLTAILHDFIIKDGSAGMLILATSWIFMAFFIVRAVLHFVRHGELMDLTNYGTPTSRLFWIGLLSIGCAFFMAQSGDISVLVLYTWSTFFLISLIYIVAVEVNCASCNIRIMDRLLKIRPLRE